MSRWPNKPLNEVAKVVRGVSFDKSQVRDIPVTGFIPILRAGNIQDSLITDTDLVYVHSDLVKHEQRIKAGDLAICMSSGSPAIVGKSAYANDNLDGSVGAFCAIIRFSNSLNHRFGAYWFKSSEYLQWRDSKAKGANIQNLRRSELEKLSLPVPPLPEQERIVKLLDESDELRKLRKQADKRSAELIPALFEGMFGDPKTNPRNWQSGSLEKFEANIRYGLGQPPEADENGIPILRATNVKHGQISEIGLMKVRRDAVPASRNAFLSADDVLVVRSGAYTGDVAQVGAKWAGSVAGYDLVVSPNGKFTGEFLTYYLLSDFVQEHYFKGLKQRSAQPHLNSMQVSNTPIFCPPISLQKDFASRYSEIRAMESEQSSSRQSLDALFQSMLHRAFQGEL